MQVVGETVGRAYVCARMYVCKFLLGINFAIFKINTQSQKLNYENSLNVCICRWYEYFCYLSITCQHSQYSENCSMTFKPTDDKMC